MLAPDGLVEIHYEIGPRGESLPDDHDPLPLGQLPVGLPMITHQPGWTWWWEMRSRLYLCLRVRPPALKAFDRDTGQPRPISWRWQPPIPVTTQWIWERIEGIDKHLRGEWFRINGRRVMDPHTETPYYARNRKPSLLVPPRLALPEPLG